MDLRKFKHACGSNASMVANHSCTFLAMEITDRLLLLVKQRRPDLSPRGYKRDLAAACNISYEAVRQWFSGNTSSIRNEHLMSIASAYDTTVDWLLTGAGDPPRRVSLYDRIEALKANETTTLSWNVGDPAPITTPFRSVKIAGTAQLGADGYWTALSPGEGHVDIPTKDKDAYALRLRGDSMSPAIRSGWVAVCEPNSQLISGEYVHIKLKGFDGEGESMVKELLYANDEEISVMSINDAFGRRTMALADIEYIHPVPFIVAPSKIVQ